MGHGGYVHGSHAVDECLDEDALDSDEAAAATAVMRAAAAALNGKSPDLIPVRKGRVLMRASSPQNNCLALYS